MKRNWDVVLVVVCKRKMWKWWSLVEENQKKWWIVLKNAKWKMKARETSLNVGVMAN